MFYRELGLRNLPGEKWLDVPNYSGYYQVSNMGRIKSLHRHRVRSDGNGLMAIRERIIRQRINKETGYLLTNFAKGGITKTKTVHRIVALAWIENPSKKPYVNHKKGIRTDNRTSQLEWNTNSENVKHSFKFLNRPTPMSMLGKTGVLNPCSHRILCDTTGEIYFGAEDAARKLNLTVGNVRHILKGRMSKTKGYTFSYL